MASTDSTETRGDQPVLFCGNEQLGAKDVPSDYKSSNSPRRSVKIGFTCDKCGKVFIVLERSLQPDCVVTCTLR